MTTSNSELNEKLATSSKKYSILKLEADNLSATIQSLTTTKTSLEQGLHGVLFRMGNSAQNSAFQIFLKKIRTKVRFADFFIRNSAVNSAFILRNTYFYKKKQYL